MKILQKRKLLRRHMARHLCLAYLPLCMAACAQAADYVVMIDTSASMRTGANALSKLKANMPSFMERIKEGDSFSLMTFDSKVRFHETYIIRDESDKAEIAKKIYSLKARGAYTNMQDMLIALSEQSEALSAAGRRLLLVIMSDGLDDPPPWLKKRRALELSSFEKKSWLGSLFRDPYIYYISLGKIQGEELASQLSLLSGQVTTLQDSSTAGLTELGADIDSKGRQRILLVFLGLIGCLSLLALAGACVYRFLTRHKLRGKLVYYDKDTGHALQDEFHLDKLRSHKFSIGRRNCHLKIRGLDSSKICNLKAKFYQDRLCLQVQTEGPSLVSYLSPSSQKEGRLIAPGEKFRIANYIFEYKADEQ